MLASIFLKAQMKVKYVTKMEYFLCMLLLTPSFYEFMKKEEEITFFECEGEVSNPKNVLASIVIKFYLHSNYLPAYRCSFQVKKNVFFGIFFASPKFTSIILHFDTHSTTSTTMDNNVVDDDKKLFIQAFAGKLIHSKPQT